MRSVAVIDIGKTNAKLARVDLDSFVETSVRKTPNVVLAEPFYPHFDIDSLRRFILKSLAELYAEAPFDAISVTTHGATGVVLDADGNLALPVIDYEFDGPDTCAADYDAVRPPFAETGSPRLERGLNVGAQLFWQQRQFPEAFARVTTILTYAQYWSFLLTGIRANEQTSLGAHTDLWNPATSDFSTMVDRLGWRPLFAPVRSSFDVLGPISGAIAAETGLPPDLPVYCGIHDSNASLLPHVLTRTAPFCVVSTGTWVIMLSVGGRQVELDETRDTLINVNALGQPVASARFMGGRGFSLLMAGREGVVASSEEADGVAARQAMLLPALPEGSGPFPHAKARFTVDEASLTYGERHAVVSFYLAMMTATSLELIGADGDVVVEGPFASNSAYLQMLAAATLRPVSPGGQGATGTSLGAACLVKSTGINPGTANSVTPPGTDYVAYVAAWRRLAQALI